MGQQASAQCATGVRAGEVVGAESARVQQSHSQRVAHRQCGGGAGGGGEAQRAGFGSDAGIEVGVGLPRQRRGRVASHGDQFGALALDQRHDHRQFVGFAAVGQRQQHVAAGDHAEVAVGRLGGMDKVRRCAGTGKGGGDLAGDVAGLAHAGDDHSAATGQQDFDCTQKSGVDAVSQRRDGGGFDFDHPSRQSHNPGGLGLASDVGCGGRGGVRHDRLVYWDYD